MEVKPGYKQTELGVMPEAWRMESLGAVCDVRDGTHESPRFFDSGVPFVTSKNIVNGQLDLENVSYISTSDAIEFDKRSKVDRNDILMSMIGTIGSAVLINFEPTFCIKNVALLKPRKVAPPFLIQLINSPVFQRYLGENLDGGIQKFVSLGTLRQLTIPVPDEPEQRAIAEALSDVDGLLGGLDRIISKKRDLKQAAMQQLLTGQTRLPGFDGEWDKTKVGSVVREGRKTQRHAGTGEKSGLYRFFTNNTQDDEMFLNQFDFDGEAVIANTGGTAFFQYFRGRFAASMHCLILFSEINVKFLYFALKLRELEINESCFQGSGLKVLNMKALRDLVLTLPRSIEEQSAIVDVLTCMDAELAALQTRRDKASLLKQGMMQELLTGRIRLVPAEARHA